MGKFFGTYLRTLDSKNRLQVPSKLVSEMPERFYALRGYEGSLSIYEEEDYQRLMARLDTMSYEKAENRHFIRLLASSINILEVDSHGRITINSDLVKLGNIHQDVVILGVVDHFELWDRISYEKYLAEQAPKFEELAAMSE